MPINRFSGFLPEEDLHVLRGTPPILLPKLLRVEWGEGDAAQSGSLEDYNNAHAPVSDVVVEFRPTFQHPPNQPTFENFKIRIARGTGELQVLAGPVPEPKPHNFIIEATLTFNGAAPLPAERTARLRVHVHKSVERVWMTPSRLSVARPDPVQPWTGRTFFRFTVRAEFDDGSAADITNTLNYAVDPADADFVTSASEPPWIRIPENMTVGQVRTISFRTMSAWNSRTAHADIAVVEPWPTASDVPNAELVDGHPDVWSGTLKPEKVPNVLFFGAGFRPLDGEAFKALTNTIVHRLRTDRQFTPYRYLATSMNYWRVSVPAPEAGVSVRCEVFSFLKDNRRFALPMPSPARPPETGEWKLEHLVYAAGLPVASDLNFVRELGETQPPPSLDSFNEIAPERLDFSGLLGKWASTILPQYVQQLNTLKSELLKRWMSLANRTFIDEVDNFPNVAVGEPPSLSPYFDQTALLNFHGYRGGFNSDPDNPQRSAFYRRLMGMTPSGTVINLDDVANLPRALGNLWTEDRANFTFDNRKFIVVICNMPIGRSERFFGRSNRPLTNLTLLARPTLRFGTPPFDLAGLPVTETPGRKALQLDMPPLASLEPLAETWEVVTHELTHAFELGDEYSEPVPGPLTAPELAFPNLMLSAVALNPDRSIEPSRIKWNWHRIRKASVITLPIVDMQDGTFRIFVAKGPGFQFAERDVVRLRQRVPRLPIGADPVTSSTEFTVQSVHPTNLSDPQDELNMTIVIKKSPGTVDVSPFKPGSLIYIPVPAPASVTPSRPYLTLVSPAAERIMAAIGGTMSGKDCDISNMEAFRARVQMPRLPLSELLKSPLLSRMPTMVGAYYGGAQVACEVLHPAGSCIMRTGTDHYTVFCPVCRYALIDLIDPEQHWRNDRDYDKEYAL